MDKTTINTIIKEVQVEITNSNPNYKYNDYYRQVELGYWDRVPKWICEFNDNYGIKNCLDIGVAMGTLLLFAYKISGCKLFATELKQHLSETLISRYNIEFKEANIEFQNVAFKSKEFDVIIFTEVFEHLKFNPIPTLRKITNMLSKNGSIFFTTPNVDVWGRLDKYNSWKDMPIAKEYQELEDLGHEYQYSKEELQEIFAECGLKVVKFGYSPSESHKAHYNIELKKI